jgi:hypothetical protein
MRVGGRDHGEHPAFVKTAVGNQHMQVGVVTEQIAEGLNHDDRARHRGFMLRKGIVLKSA